MFGEMKVISGAATGVAVAALSVATVAGCGSAPKKATGPHLGCKRQGIRFTGRANPGVKVCFTLSSDAKSWLEIGFLSAGAEGCPGGPSAVYEPGPYERSAPGQIIFDDFTATVEGATASGVIENRYFCRGKRFTWTARRSSSGTG
jgi:hypothetical protein